MPNCLKKKIIIMKNFNGPKCRPFFDCAQNVFIFILGVQTAFVRFTHKFKFSCFYADESITVYLIIVSKN